MASSVSRWLSTFSVHGNTAAHKSPAPGDVAGGSGNMWPHALDDSSSSAAEDSGGQNPSQPRVETPMLRSTGAQTAAALSSSASKTSARDKNSGASVGLSAHSTLESLSVGGPGRRPAAIAAASPSSVLSHASLTSVASHHNEGVCFRTGSPPPLSQQQAQVSTHVTLHPLFQCVSAFLSPADVRLSVPLTRLYDPMGPVIFPSPPLEGSRSHRGELFLWPNESERVISQNSSKRRVHRALWISASQPSCPRPTAIKFVEDANARDGRSLKREIDCHTYVYKKLPTLFQLEHELRASQIASNYSFTRLPEWSVTERVEDAWPSAELFGYHLDKKDPGRCVLLTRKLSGPDLFDVIRAEHSHTWHFHHPSNNQNSLMDKCRTIYSHRHLLSTGALSSAGGGLTSGNSASRALLKAISNGFEGKCAYYPFNYEYHKLRWCALALKRISQYGALGIRHNDVKPDNIVLDFYMSSTTGQECLDVKLIDLGTVSFYNAKDFTGGTSWYESPEQKLLEYFMKKKKKIDAAKRVNINLSSDLWGAGISISEILIGRRVVDTLKSGPGSLDYLGYEDTVSRRAQGRSEGGGSHHTRDPHGLSDLDPITTSCDWSGDGGHLNSYPYWAIQPGDWIGYARSALCLDRDPSTQGRLTHEAAKWIFSHLVRPDPESRVSVNVAMNKLERFAEEAYRRYRHLCNSFDTPTHLSHRGATNPNPSGFNIPGRYSEASTASTPVVLSLLAVNQRQQQPPLPKRKDDYQP